VTLVFTDIEGSADLFQRLGDERAHAIVRNHDRLLNEAIRRHGGTEVKHQGDGVMAAFSSARRALRCAVEIQQALTEQNRAHPETPLHVRIGIHTSEVIAEDDDYFGAGVVLAARIARAAGGGEVSTGPSGSSRRAGRGRRRWVDRPTSPRPGREP
jgi:class 3 adenylate cyclase